MIFFLFLSWMPCHCVRDQRCGGRLDGDNQDSSGELDWVLNVYPRTTVRRRSSGRPFYDRVHLYHSLTRSPLLLTLKSSSLSILSTHSPIQSLNSTQLICQLDAISAVRKAVSEAEMTAEREISLATDLRKASLDTVKVMSTSINSWASVSQYLSFRA